MRGSSFAQFTLIFPRMYCRNPFHFVYCRVMKDVIRQSFMGEGRESKHLMQGCSKRLIGCIYIRHQRWWKQRGEETLRRKEGSQHLTSLGIQFWALSCWGKSPKCRCLTSPHLFPKQYSSSSLQPWTTCAGVCRIAPLSPTCLMATCQTCRNQILLNRPLPDQPQDQLRCPRARRESLSNPSL